MAQKLILPIGNCQINAGYKSEIYKKTWGFAHYGVDLIEKNTKRTVYACGSGKVIACGMDGDTDKLRMGNCIVIVYPGVLLPDGTVRSVACRMFHLAKISCKAGDSVSVGQAIGEYGNTGAHTSGAHLHIEFDLDTDYPAYAYGISQSGKVIKRGSLDSTIDPCKVFWLGDGQSFTSPAAWITEGWVSYASLLLQKASSEPNGAVLAALTAENSKLKERLAQIHQISS